MAYWKQFWSRFGKDFIAATGEQVVGALLVVGILFYQIRYGVIHAAEVRGSYLAIAWPYVFLVGALFLWHLGRTPYLLHLETKKQVAAETEAGIREKEAKPEFKAEIDCVVRNVLNEGHFFVHAHVVNLNDGSASIRRVSLKNHTTGELFPSLRFDKCFVLRNGEKKLSATLTEDGVLRTKEARFKDEVLDLSERLKLPLIKGDGKEGWLLFQKAYSVQETESPSLSLQIEDAFGAIHESNTANGRYEYGSFCK